MSLQEQIGMIGYPSGCDLQVRMMAKCEAVDWLSGCCLNVRIGLNVTLQVCNRSKQEKISAAI